jgi:hypothetical protein
LSAIVTGCWRAPETFLTASFFNRGSARSYSRAGIGLGTTVKYPQCTTTQRPEHCATHNERCRGQRTGHLDQVSTTHNERRRGQRPKPMPGITNVPLHHMCPAFAFLVRASFANKQNVTARCWGLSAQCLCAEPELSPCVHKQIHSNKCYLFLRRLKIISPTHKRTAGRAPVCGSEFTTKVALKGGFSRSRDWCEPPPRLFPGQRPCKIRCATHFPRSPPSSYGNRFQLAEGTSPRGLTYHCIHKADTPHICRAGRRIATAIDFNSPKEHRPED